VSLCVWKIVQGHVVVPMKAEELVDERLFQLCKTIGEGDGIGEI
jgi:hypothetical protein